MDYHHDQYAAGLQIRTSKGLFRRTVANAIDKLFSNLLRLRLQNKAPYSAAFREAHFNAPEAQKQICQGAKHVKCHIKSVQLLQCFASTVG